MILSKRQRFLIRCCIDAELEMSDQGDTNLSLSVIENAEDPDEAQEALRQELIAIQNLMKSEQESQSMSEAERVEELKSELSTIMSEIIVHNFLTEKEDIKEEEVYEEG